MKKLILYLLISLCFLSGCSYSNTDSPNNAKKQSLNINPSGIASNVPSIASYSSDVSSKEEGKSMHGYGAFDSAESESIQSVMSISDSSTDYNRLIKKEVSVNDYANDFLFHEYSPMLGYNPVIVTINDKYPVECLRKIGNHTYSIYKGDDGSIIFTFYMDNGFEAHCIYMKKKLSTENFKNIRIGSHLTDVENIDSAATIRATRCISEKVNIFFSFHLLTDGILKFTYTRQSDGSYLVSDKYYNKDFKYSAGPKANPTNFDFTILPQDYIH